MLFPVLIIMLLISGAGIKDIESDPHLKVLLTIRDDTSGLIRLVRVDSFRLSIIPPSSGVQFYRDKIVFLSRSKNERKMSPNQISFGAVEAYYASVEDSVTGRHVIFSPSSSFSYPCEAITFSRDYNTMFFSMIPKKGNKEKIFMAKFTSNSKNQTELVPDLSPLGFCTDNSNYTHPTLSSDGNMMIFASDREGSFGGMDLFLSRRSAETWSAPENLGISINTAGNEFYPFLDSENNLYFSSDRLPGFGGYDIFTCKFNGAGWDKPGNMSDRINSADDDIAFTINKLDDKTAFFTRRQISQKSEMQLFRVSLIQEIADRNPLTISYVFNGKPATGTSLIAVSAVTEAKPPVSEPAKRKPDTAVIKKTEVKVPDSTTSRKISVAKGVVAKTESHVTTPESKAVTPKIVKPEQTGQKDIIIYRVQLLPSTSQKSSGAMIINGTSYKLYEYKYLGVNRYTIGEFSTLAPAIALQRICRQSGYPQSFVVAFKNDIRSLDLNLFK